jgi:Predicted nucleic acid-binding protein, contains PIN domain
VKVIDASVVIELIAFDLDPERLGNEPLAAPHLLDSEVLSSLRPLTHTRELSESDAERALQTFTDMAIERHPAAPLRHRIWELRHNLSVYDATYVALTEALDATSLLTVDEPLLTAPGTRCRIERP